MVALKFAEELPVPITTLAGTVINGVEELSETVVFDATNCVSATVHEVDAPETTAVGLQRSEPMDAGVPGAGAVKVIAADCAAPL